MQVVLGLLCALAVGASADYHQEVGIPLAARIKEAEDRIFAVGHNVESAKIAGGDVTPYNAHPYMAGMIVHLPDKQTSFCGSSLVSSKRLVTAAHCWHADSTFEMVFASQYLFRGGTRVRTTKVAVHPYYNTDTAANDIAVIYLPQAIKFNENIQPINLATSPMQDANVGESVLAVGYGASQTEWTNPMKQIFLSVVSERGCKNTFSHYPELGTTICTTGFGGACGGDSGGPLIVKRNGRKILVGVTSFKWDIPCGQKSPSVFTRISSHYNFLKKHIDTLRRAKMVITPF